MGITDEPFLASILLSIPFIRMFQKLGVNHSDQQPPQPTPEHVLSQHQEPPLDKAA